MQKINYRTSRDYEKLFNLISSGKEIVCFVDAYEICRDVCVARLRDDRFSLSARGTEYSRIYGKFSQVKIPDLIASWEAQNLEYIDPDLQSTKCSKCKVEFLGVTGDCPVCYYRTMAAKYGFIMARLRDALKIVEADDDQAEMKRIAHLALNETPYFNFLEIYSDCLMVLMECGEFMEKAIKHDLPDEIVPDIVKLNEMMKTMISKYRDVGGV